MFVWEILNRWIKSHKHPKILNYIVSLKFKSNNVKKYQISLNFFRRLFLLSWNESNFMWLFFNCHCAMWLNKNITFIYVLMSIVPYWSNQLPRLWFVTVLLKFNFFLYHGLKFNIFHDSIMMMFLAIYFKEWI